MIFTKNEEQEVTVYQFGGCADYLLYPEIRMDNSGGHRRYRRLHPGLSQSTRINRWERARYAEYEDLFDGAFWELFAQRLLLRDDWFKILWRCGWFKHVSLGIR